jgi:integrase
VSLGFDTPPTESSNSSANGSRAKWQGHKTHTMKPIRPGTVNRELDTLRAIFSKAIEWGQLREHPMRSVKRLKVDNRRTRILTETEQLALLAACPKKLAVMVRLALITGARFGELLSLKWADVTDTELWFMETKNGRARAIPVSEAIRAVLKQVPKPVKVSAWVFTNSRTREAYTVNGVAHVFKRAVKRANILTGDVTLHTLRHTALSRMIASGIDDFTVMAISGHRSVRMLERYTHPTNARKVDALESFTASLGRTWAEFENESDANPNSSADSLGKSGGRQEARTPDLCVANAALSQLS